MPIKPEVTFIIPIIQSNYIKTCLETLYKFTPVEFRVIVIDQTGTDEAFIDAGNLAHLWITSYRNLGFSKAMNTGIRLSDTPYIGLLNDDLEFISDKWWQGILDTFSMDERIIAVNPMSPKEGSWGYGYREDNKDTWQPREGFVTDESRLGVYPLINGSPIDTAVEASKHYDDLLNNHPVWNKDSMCDGIAMWATIFKKSGLDEVGLLDERFYPGGGEDYCMNIRAYSCAFPIDREECDEKYHYRMVGSTKSWVWHYWSSSRGVNPDNKVFDSRERWNSLDELYHPKVDVWGHYIDDNGVRRPIKRRDKVFTDDL